MYEWMRDFCSFFVFEIDFMLISERHLKKSFDPKRRVQKENTWWQTETKMR